MSTYCIVRVTYLHFFHFFLIKANSNISRLNQSLYRGGGASNVNDFGRWWIRRWHITRDWYKMCLVSASNVFIWNFILRTKVSKLVELTFFQPSSAPSSELQKKLIQVQKAKHKRQNIIAIIEIAKNIDNPIKMSSFSS